MVLSSYEYEERIMIMHNLTKVAQGQVFYISSMDTVLDESGSSRLIMKSRPWVVISANSIIRSTGRAMICPLASHSNNSSWMDIPYYYRGNLKYIRMSEIQTVTDYKLLNDCEYKFTMDQDVIATINYRFRYLTNDQMFSDIPENALYNAISNVFKESAGRRVNLNTLTNFIIRAVAETISSPTSKYNTEDNAILITLPGEADSESSNNV